MKRVMILLMAAALLLGLAACGGTALPTETAAETPGPTETHTATPAPTPVPTEPPVPMVLQLPPLPEGWADIYLSFLEDNYDIFAALWPDGLTGVGFIDLDLDGMPEMVIFDQGASATLGVQLFDVVDGQVYCVSSALDSAAGAFGGEYFSLLSVCTSYFEAFRLSYTDEGYTFWITSSNGTLESSWDEIIRFDSTDGILTPESVCGRYLESDAETGQIVSQHYTVAGEEADEQAYSEAAAVYLSAGDMGYDAKGVFLWNDMNRYDTTYDGFMAMARDAAEGYVPIAVS